MYSIVFVLRTCNGTDLHQTQWIWLFQVADLPRNNATKTIQKHLKLVLELPLAKTIYWENTPISVIRHMGIITCLESSHFEVLHRYISTVHSTRHPVRNQPPVHAKNMKVMGHGGKDITFTEVVMVGMKCSPLCRSQNKSRHLLVLWECLQDHWKSMQSIGEHLPGQILSLNLIALHLEEPWVACKWKYSSGLENLRKLKSKGLQSLPHCSRSHPTILMQQMRGTICQTCTVPKANHQSTSSQLNTPWTNIPKGWRWPTNVRSTGGIMYGLLGFGSRSIGQLPRIRIVSNRVEMDPCTGRWHMQVIWKHWRAGCHWILLTMLTGCVGSGFRSFWTHVQVKFRKEGGQQDKATTDQRQIWVSAGAQWQRKTSPSCQIQSSWLWFTGYQIARIWF